MALYIESGFDLGDEPYSIDVVETGGNSFTASLSSGTYFFSTDASSATGDQSALVTGYGDFLAALEAALDTGGAAGAGAYTVSFSTSTARVTITHSGAGGVTAIQLTANTRGTYIGHTTVLSGALTHELDTAPYHWLSGTVGYWSRYVDHEIGDMATDVVSHSARPYGIARVTPEHEIRMDVSMEPRAIVYTDHAAAASPWTWQRFFRHVRNIQPIMINDGTHKHYCKLQDRGALFSPRSVSSDYVGHWDIRLRMRLLAREDA
jgi:hypothetical protein